MPLLRKKPQLSRNCCGDTPEDAAATETAALLAELVSWWLDAGHGMEAVL
jgi:hypothetical protein